MGGSGLIGMSAFCTWLAALAVLVCLKPANATTGGHVWKEATAVEPNSWMAVTFGRRKEITTTAELGVFVAVAASGASRVMTSADGREWTARRAAEQNMWHDVAYGDGLFVAVAAVGVHQVMTSPDGITWTPRGATEANAWRAVTYGATIAGSSLFVAVASSGTNRVMTSTNGVDWIARSAAEQNKWMSVTSSPHGLFVAVATTGTNKVMYSLDAITWTATAATEDNTWNAVTYGNGYFVAVSEDGANRVMVSAPVIGGNIAIVTWMSVSAAAQNMWRSVTYANGLFVAVASSGTHQVMTSPDGMTWTARTAASASGWRAVVYGNGLYLAVANTAVNRYTQVMYSATLEVPTPAPTVVAPGQPSAGVAHDVRVPYMRVTENIGQSADILVHWRSTSGLDKPAPSHPWDWIALYRAGSCQQSRNMKTTTTDQNACYLAWTYVHPPGGGTEGVVTFPYILTKWPAGQYEIRYFLGDSQQKYGTVCHVQDNAPGGALYCALEAAATSNRFYVEADPNLQGYQAFQHGRTKFVSGFEHGF